MLCQDQRNHRSQLSSYTWSAGVKHVLPRSFLRSRLQRADISSRSGFCIAKKQSWEGGQKLVISKNRDLEVIDLFLKLYTDWHRSRVCRIQLFQQHRARSSELHTASFWMFSRVLPSLNYRSLGNSKLHLGKTLQIFQILINKLGEIKTHFEMFVVHLRLFCLRNSTFFFLAPQPILVMWSANFL